jgi:predicted amidohydrolase YtcJ
VSTQKWRSFDGHAGDVHGVPGRYKKRGIMAVFSNGFNIRAIIAITLLMIIPSAGQSDTDDDQHAFADRVITGAKIYTVNPEQPWAEAVAIKDGRFVYVGDHSGIRKWIGPKTKKMGLDGKLVLPGIVDSHTHPGIVAGSVEMIPMPFTEIAPLPYTGKKQVLAWLKAYAAKHPEQTAIVAGTWRQEDFGAEGPNKRDLDAIVSDRPVILLERWGHSCWMNSKALDAMGATRNTPDAVPGLACYQRDEKGELTGWAKEGLAWTAIFKMIRLEGKYEKMFVFFMDYLAAHGVTTVFDAGNMNAEDIAYSQISKKIGRAHV